MIDLKTIAAEATLAGALGLTATQISEECSTT